MEKLVIKSVLMGLSILIMGDSLSISLAEQMKQILTNTKIYSTGIISSGLENTTKTDWVLRSKRMIKQYRPDLIIILIGMNDSGENYKQLVTRFYRNMYDYPVYFIQIPATNKVEKNQQISIINDILKEMSLTSDFYFIETSFQEFNPKFHRPDGIHLNLMGNKAFTQEVITEIERVHRSHMR